MNAAGAARIGSQRRRTSDAKKRIGVSSTAWYAVSVATAMTSADRTGRSAKYSATPKSQKARNGTSDSSELPLTTNGGTTMNKSTASSARSVYRRAIDHADIAAIK